MKSDHRGFTLIEMLVVIGIIALLMGILLPGVMLAKEAAYRSRARDMTGQLVMAWKSYLSDNRSFPTDEVVIQMDTAALYLLNKNPNNKYLDVKTSEQISGLLDPWGEMLYRKGDIEWKKHLYRVALDNGTGYDAGDAPYNGQVRTPHGVVRKSVAVWSPGRDGQDATRDDVKSWR